MMRVLARLLRLTVFFIVFLAFAFVLTKDMLLARGLEVVLEKHLGLRVDIGSMETSFLRGHFVARGVVFKNPPQFDREILGYVPKLTMKLDPLEWLMGNKHFYLFDFQAETIKIIKNENGENNLEVMADEVRAKVQGGGAAGVGIDFLRFDLIDVFFYDESDKDSRVRAYPLQKYDLTYKNVDSMSQISDLMVVEILKETKLNEALNIAVNRMKAGLGNVVAVPSRKADSYFRPIGIDRLFSWTRSDRRLISTDS